MLLKKFNYFKNIKKISRKEKSNINRIKYIRLDKNERIIKFENFFLNKIKKKLSSHHLHTYPSLNNIYKIIAKKEKLNTKNLILTNGSDIAIKRCFELFGRKKSEIITLNPTYGMVDVYCKLFEVRQKKVDCDKNLIFDGYKILNKINKKTSLIIIANPNSPTGKIIPMETIELILDKAKKNNSYVLLDECYYDYSNFTTIGLIKEYKNLIVCRSFSKVGLAGCRVGFLATNSVTRDILYKFRPFYEITSFSAFVLEEFLKHDSLIKNYAKKITEGKKIIENFFKKKNIKYFSTSTNFIIFTLNNKKLTKKVYIKLKQNLFLVNIIKKISSNYDLIKFTLGPKKIMNKFINMIDQEIK